MERKDIIKLILLALVALYIIGISIQRSKHKANENKDKIENTHGGHEIHIDSHENSHSIH